MTEEDVLKDWYQLMGEPVGKGRPRFTRNGHAYTPRDTRVYEDLVAWCVRAKHLPRLTGPLRLEAFFYCTRHPDLDNLVKALLDGCQRGGALINDNQVEEIIAVRLQSEIPRVEFTLVPIEESEPGPI
jgi:Holliday junction resolvase RusA-like endonuclease